MKKTLLKLTLVFTATIFASISANAAVLTVSNNSVTAGKYTDLQKAADAAKAGDTIYVHPSMTSYGNLVIKKQLTILGGGYRRDESQESNWISQVGTIEFDETLLETDGSKIIGLYINSSIGAATTYNVDNITIDRCFTTSIYLTGNGWVIKNGFVNNFIVLNSKSNTIISNNIMYAYITTSDKPSVLVLNNFFIGRTDYFGTLTNVIFANNIFLNQSGTFGSGNSNYNVFNNNAFIRGTSSTFTSLPGTNTGASNLFTTLSSFSLKDTAMTLTSTVNAPSSVSSNPRFNKDNWTFDLKATSPGKNYGTDGTDIGIFGGAYPMQNINGVPAIPFITKLNLLNAVVPASADLEFELKAKSIK